MSSVILVIDLGSQYTQVLARKIRVLGVFCEVKSGYLTSGQLKKINPQGIILSGSHNSVFDIESNDVYDRIFNFGVPVLCVCYGMQLIAEEFGGKVVKSEKGEYGEAVVNVIFRDAIFKDIKNRATVWMSHGDKVVSLPPEFKMTSETDNFQISSMSYEEKKIYRVQFHPEVSHTSIGAHLLENFVKISGCERDWVPEKISEKSVFSIRKTVENGKVLLGVSGGVDSLVAALILRKAIGDRLVLVFVNNGLLRLDEEIEVQKIFLAQDLQVHVVDACNEFLEALEGVSNPEAKRKIIGEIFVKVFERKSKEFTGVIFLGQGTIYSDVIESAKSKDGTAVVIKSHHNVGGLPAKMNLKVVEPLKELFKDEVRKLGIELGLPERLVNRHPFPRPGLGIRIIGESSKNI